MTGAFKNRTIGDLLKFRRGEGPGFVFTGLALALLAIHSKSFSAFRADDGLGPVAGDIAV
jgi:hypothetical protein